MYKLSLNPQNTDSIYLAETASKTCTCYGCGGCLACLVFAPLSAAFIFITLGITQDQTQGK